MLVTVVQAPFGKYCVAMVVVLHVNEWVVEENYILIYYNNVSNANAHYRRGGRHDVLLIHAYHDINYYSSNSSSTRDDHSSKIVLTLRHKRTTHQRRNSC